MQKKPILKIVLIVGLGAILVVGIFWVGKNFGEKKDTSQVKTHQLKTRQKPSRQLTIKCNGAAGGKCEYINIANPQERILIDTKNKVFYFDDALYIKDNQYIISFNEADAVKKGNNFIFDENNNKFTLTSNTFG